MKDMNKMNCLIFDDHPLVCVAIKSLLKELGMTNEVFTATSAKSAFKTLKESNIELLILDVNLADCDALISTNASNPTVMKARSFSSRRKPAKCTVKWRFDLAQMAMCANRKITTF